MLDSQPVTDPAQADAVAKLRTWQAGRRAAGGDRRPARKTYRHADAIRHLRRVVAAAGRGEFRPGLGDDLYAALVDALQINESPSGGQNGAARRRRRPNQGQAHKGSSFQYGWWGYVDKDLRAVLGDPVAGGLGRDLLRRRRPGRAAGRRCSSTLGRGRGRAGHHRLPGRRALRGRRPVVRRHDHPVAARRHHATTRSPGRTGPPTSRWCRSRRSRGDDIANLAQGRTASASSTQFLGQLTPAAAVDGDPTTRWSSWWTRQPVDHGRPRRGPHGRPGRSCAGRRRTAARTGSRSPTDGSTWQPVFTATTGNGGIDNVTFAPVTARYVRMVGVDRATAYGYSLWEFEAYPK